MACAYQLYPAARYHRDGRGCLVRNAEEDAALGPEWKDSPAAFVNQIEPAVEAPAPPKAQRKPPRRTQPKGIEEK